MAQPTEEVLRKIDMFRRVGPADRQHILQVSRLQRFPRGELIFREGEPAETFLAIVEGRVKVFKAAPGGKESFWRSSTAATRWGPWPFTKTGICRPLRSRFRTRNASRSVAPISLRCSSTPLWFVRFCPGSRCGWSSSRGVLRN